MASVNTGRRRVTGSSRRNGRVTESYRPFARQKEFHRSKAKYRLFGGAAGPGKTKALLWEAIGQALNVAGCDTLLLRRTYPELEGSLLAQFRRDVPRGWYRDYNEAKHMVTWKNGSTTRFGYCRNENDVYQYQGAEFLFIGIDELTHFTLKQWQFLTSRNRCAVKKYTAGPNKDKKVLPCMAGATNPGNIGHAWVKALWVDKVPPAGYDRPEQYDPADYAFIPARIADNPIYANDQNYLKTLDALPQQLRKAFLEGTWDVFAGQYFDLFEVGRHTARAEEMGMQWWWPRWISIDWGFHHPSAVYWHCGLPAGTAGGCKWREAREEKDDAEGRRGTDSRREENSRSLADARDDTFNLNGGSGLDGGIEEGFLTSRTPLGMTEQNDSGALGGGDRKGLTPEGVSYRGGPRIITYREFVKTGLSSRALGEAIAELSQDERIGNVFLSPDAFSHRTNEASIAEQLGEVLERHGLPRPSQAEDDRIGGWQLMYQLLENDGWVITENCRGLIECLPNLVRDERRVEDVRKVEGDDAADAARYGLVSGVRYAGIGAHGCAPGAGQAPPDKFGEARFVPGMPVEIQIEKMIGATDPTSRAIHRERLMAEAKRQLGAHRFGGRRKWW